MTVRKPVVPANSRFGAKQLAKIILASVLGTMAALYFWYGASGGTSDLNDFGSFLASGKALTEGLNPYGIYASTFRPDSTGIAHPNLNPPASLLLFAPLSLAEPNIAFEVVWWGGLLGYLAVIVILLRRQPDQDAVLPMAAWALALPALWDGLQLGQIYLGLLVVVAGAWYLLERGCAARAGLLIGIFLAVKPNFLFWPVLLFFTGHRRAAVWAGISFFALSLLPLLVFGPDIYKQWFDVVVAETGGREGFFTNASIMSIGYRAGSTVTTVLLVLAILTWTVAQILRKQTDVADASAIGIGLGIVLSPVAWFHYMIFLLPAMLTRRWSPRILIAAVLMLVPAAMLHMIYMSPLAQNPALTGPVLATFGSVYSWTALFLLAGFARRNN